MLTYVTCTCSQELSKDADANSSEIAKREDLLLPLYTQIAHEFADMHDRTGRMAAKGAIRCAVPWAESRRFFHKRVMRRLAQQDLANNLMEECAQVTSLNEAFSTISSWAAEAGVEWENDDEVIAWLQQDQSDKVEKAVREGLAQQVADLLSGIGSEDSQQILEQVAKLQQ